MAQNVPVYFLLRIYHKFHLFGLVLRQTTVLQDSKKLLGMKLETGFSFIYLLQILPVSLNCMDGIFVFELQYFKHACVLASVCVIT